MSQSSVTTEPYRTFLFSYRHEGASWVLEVPARDADDAQARIAKLSSATYDGELVMKVPVPGGATGRLAAWWASKVGRAL